MMYTKSGVVHVTLNVLPRNIHIKRKIYFTMLTAILRNHAAIIDKSDKDIIIPTIAS